jgi:hypothetical protein
MEHRLIEVGRRVSECMESAMSLTIVILEAAVSLSTPIKEGWNKRSAERALINACGQKAADSFIKSIHGFDPIKGVPEEEYW